MGTTARDRLGLKSPCTRRVMALRIGKNGAAFHSGEATTMQSVSSREGKIPPTPLCESGAQDTLIHMTHSTRGRATFSYLVVDCRTFSSLKRAGDHRSDLKAEIPGGSEVIWANDGVLGLEAQFDWHLSPANCLGDSQSDG